MGKVGVGSKQGLLPRTEWGRISSSYRLHLHPAVSLSLETMNRSLPLVPITKEGAEEQVTQPWPIFCCCPAALPQEEMARET